jgi:hypothetical protein
LAAQTLGKYQQGAQGEPETPTGDQELVAPVVSLDKLDGRIRHRSSRGCIQALTTQVRSLSGAGRPAPRDALNLVGAAPAGSGRTLGRASAASRRRNGGDGRHCDFIEQASVTGRRQAAARRHRPSSGG